MRSVLPSLRPRRVAGALALLLAAGVAGYGGSALAGSGQTFSDVPPSHTFYDEIEWLADSGITTGYPDGSFRPGAPVTRQAMAAYLQRLHAGFTLHTSALTDPGSSLFWSHITTCPAGKRAVAGGGVTSAVDVFMTDSRPTPSGDGWYVRWESDDETPKASVEVTVHATCIPDNP